MAIIAVSGKPGNPFLLVSAPSDSKSGLKKLPDFTQTLGALGPLYRSVARGMGERHVTEDIGPPTSYGETLPGPHSCDWPRASKGWTNP